MNRLARLSFPFAVVGLAVACGGNVETPVGTTGTGAGASGAAGTGTGGTSAKGGAGGSGGDAGASSTAGTGGTSSKGGSGGTGGTSSKGGSGGTGGTSSKGGSGGTGGGIGGTGGTSGASCQAAKPLPDPCDCVPQGPAGYYWDGSVCADLVACCPKVENGELYPTVAACKAAHASCGSCAAGTVGPDPCDCDPGKKVYYWDGKSCTNALVCCPEGGAKLYESEAACAAEHESCNQGKTCKIDADCGPPPPCQLCADGSDTCTKVTCDAGLCMVVAGKPCPPSCELACSNGCGYADKQCGKGTPGGGCLPMPKCASTYEPVCGCDGKVHTNECLAMTVGVDTSVLGNCVAPEGHFACGDHFCAKGKQYCQRLASDVGGFADSFACKAIPAACDAPGGGGGPCSCFEKEPCGAICKPDAEGYITLTCPGG